MIKMANLLNKRTYIYELFKFGVCSNTVNFRESTTISAKSLIEQLKKYGGLKLNSCKMNKIVDEFFYMWTPGMC